MNRILFILLSEAELSNPFTAIEEYAPQDHYYCLSLQFRFGLKRQNRMKHSWPLFRFLAVHKMLMLQEVIQEDIQFVVEKMARPSGLFLHISKLFVAGKTMKDCGTGTT